MPTDYASIKAENERRYGTDIGRIGPMLLAHRYQDRTHFIFELLQNAEDALRRRNSWNGPRSVTFSLLDEALQVSHFGEPFSEPDVRGICGIAQSTKTLTSIGRFGIGFKSVYAFSDRPEIHSGLEHFAIDNFVWPQAVDHIDVEPEETRFILPLRTSDSNARAEIGRGLRRLGPRVLLFLREIEEITWADRDGAGSYLRDKPNLILNNARKITVIGQDRGIEDVNEEHWLIFDREAVTPEGELAGHVEVAFSLDVGKSGAWAVRPTEEPTLVVFFPTIVPTNTGFLIQGPYRTTPSRDNVPRDDEWNQHLVQATSSLLIEALRSLRDLGKLNAGALRTLPLDRAKFAEGTLIAPLFETVREALVREDLIPRFGGGTVAGQRARLARVQELRQLISAPQLTEIYQVPEQNCWVTEEITQDRTPELRQYLMREIKVPEVRPEDLVPLLTKEFLEKQSDGWLIRLYEFLSDQSSLLRAGRLSDLPLIRLEDGSQVCLLDKGRRQAFLPGPAPTGFPTVRAAVCASNQAKTFLRTLGVTEPDPVDDVIRNVLPHYVGPSIKLEPKVYAGHISRMVTAFSTDSKSRREALIAALRESTFLSVVDVGSGKRYLAKPQNVYLATERLKALFKDIAGVLVVDDAYDCLKGEDVRELLEACGSTRYLERKAIPSTFSYTEKFEMRKQAGYASSTGGESIEEFTIRGLDELLKTLPTLSRPEACARARLLWEALCDLEDRRGARVFVGTYRWYYFTSRSCEFDAAFVRSLNAIAWVPDINGILKLPSEVVFSETGWKPNQLIASKILFKPPVIEALAKEVGIEPGVLNLLKELGVTSEAQLKARLGIGSTSAISTGDAEGERESNDDLDVDATSTESQENSSGPVSGSGPLGSSAADLATGSTPAEQPNDPVGSAAAAQSGNAAGNMSANGTSGRSSGSSSGGHLKPDGSGPNSSKAGSAGSRPFISYVGTHFDDEDSDPDGLDQNERLELEERAIALIQHAEPQLQRTPANNPGFDLIEPGPDQTAVRLIEVKAMRGRFDSRPVGLSKTQFNCAREHGDRYFLYVVESASTASEARIIRIQDPVGKARTFTFDHGWASVADVIEPEGLEGL